MKEFLNLLEQSIAILDENKRLIGLNKAALQYLGYENMLLNIELCGLEVKADKVCLSILNNQGEYTQGSMHIERSSMEGEGCWLGIIQWEERLEKQQTAELIEAFLEHIDQSICIKDKKGNYVYCNKHYRERINAPKNIIGTRDEDYWGKQYSDAFKESDDYVLENYKQCSIEEEVLEEEKYFETIKFPVVKDEDFYIGIIIKDITIQKVLYNQRVDEQTCMDKGKKLSGILTGIKEYFKTSSVNIWIYDEEKEVLGPCFNIDYIKNLMGEQMWIPMSKEMAIVIKTKGEAIIRTNKFPLSTNEEEVDETKPIFYVIYYPIVYRGNLVGVLNIIVDEEPKKFVVKNYFMNSICQQIGIMLAEQKMKQALENECVQRTNCEENLNKLLEITVDIIIRVDEQGYFKWVSQEGMQILGWSEEALLKLRWQDIIHPEDYDKIQDRMSTWEGEGEIGTCVTRCCCKNGTYKWLRWQGCYQEKGGLYVATAKDITREVELEAKENLAKDALQIEKLKGEFFANLSHEFRTPLTIIISALQM